MRIRWGMIFLYLITMAIAFTVALNGVVIILKAPPVVGNMAAVVIAVVSIIVFIKFSTKKFSEKG